MERRYADDSQENFSEILEEIPENLLENLEILAKNLQENHEQTLVLGSKKTILDVASFYAWDCFRDWRIHGLQECYVRKIWLTKLNTLHSFEC